jgi:hypothetical protein
MHESKTANFARTLELLAGLLRKTKSPDIATELEGRVKAIRTELEYTVWANTLRR